MEAGSYLEQAADPPPDPHPAGGWGRDAREDLQQRGFSRTIGADDRERLPLVDFEGDVPLKPRNRLFQRSAPSWGMVPALRLSSYPPTVNVREHLSAVDLAETVALRDVLYRDCEGHDESARAQR